MKGFSTTGELDPPFDITEANRALFGHPALDLSEILLPELLMESEIIKTAMDLLTPVLESSIVVGAQYVKLCGRNVITSHDTEYGMKFAARNVVGKQIGTLFPEIYEDTTDSETDSDFEEVDEDDSPFSRYTGPQNDFVDSVHQAVDTWESWEPQNPTEKLLKSAIDTMGLR